MGWQNRPVRTVPWVPRTRLVPLSERSAHHQRSRRRERTDESIGRTLLTRASAVATRSNRPPRAFSTAPAAPPDRAGTVVSVYMPYRHVISSSSSSPADRMSDSPGHRARFEKLIKEIYKRSCIWDPADVNHLNKEMLTNMWTEIAENLYSDWHTLSSFDKRDRVSDVKKKWTNIKDSFVKDVKGNKPRKSLRLPEHRKKYYLFDHLQFLIPFIQDSKSGGGGRSAEDGVRKPVEKKMRKNTLHGECSTQNTLSISSEAVAKRLEKIQPDVQQHAALLNNLASKTVTDTLCHLDGDMSFMVSLLPTIKSMNEKQKINFKIGVLQLMSRIKFDEAKNNPPGVTYDQLTAATANHTRFPAPHQLQVTNIPGVKHPLVNVAMSSTQKQQHHHNQQPSVEHTMPVKQEVVDSSPESSLWCYDTSTDEDVEYP